MLLLGLQAFSGATAAEVVGEQHLAQILSRSLTYGDLVWLEAGGQRFFGIYTAAQARTTRGGAVIVPDFGANADWPEVVEPLRSRLPQVGWATLSVQLPIPVSDAPIAAYGREVTQAGQRIAAAIAYLRGHKLKPIVLIGHGLGAAICAQVLASGQVKDVAALVAVGMASMPALRPQLDVPAELRELKLPVLDLYGGRDLDRVLRMAPKRLAAAREAHNTRYDQLEIDGAGHGFHDMRDLLVSRVSGWLNKQTGAAPGSAAAAETP